MFRNHLIVALRNIWRRKAFSFINILGLAVGIAATLLIFLVIRSETGYDAWQSNANRIYRVVSTNRVASNGEVKGYSASVALPLPEAMRPEFPQIKKIGHIWNIGEAQVHVPGPRGLEDEKIFRQQKGLYWTTPDLFSMFDYQWLEGDATGLSTPNTAVVAQSLAETWYGSVHEAMGKTVQMWSFRVPLRIIGVFKDLPYNTDMELSMGASMTTFEKLNGRPFNDPSRWNEQPWPSQCFVMLNSDKDQASVQRMLPAFVAKYLPAEKTQGSVRTELSLQPLREVHLDERWGTFKSDALTTRELWALALIGVFLLLVACINFVNLSTALSVTRAREIGVRKVLGGSRAGLLGQFLQETAFLCLISIVLGCLVAKMALPWLSSLIAKPLVLDLQGQPGIWMFLLATGIVVTILAGLYPGLVLSGFNPAAAMKSRLSMKTAGGISLRRGLVVLQFVIAQLLIIGTLVVIRQMQFFRSRPLGFERNAIGLIELPSDSLDRTKYPYLKEQLDKIAGVEATSYCMDAPAAWGFPTKEIYFENDPVKKDFEVQTQIADTGYLNTFRIGLAAGRLPFASDTVRELLVNETLVKKLGLRSSGEMLGRRIGYKNGNGLVYYPVVGVIRDYNSRSLRSNIDPMVLVTDAGAYNYISFRMQPEAMNKALESVHAVFHSTFPYYIYNLHFMDQTLDAFYHTELITGSLFKVFACLAIFISCLGLYGLVSFMAVQKTREVGIRKVLGASVRSIVYMFSKEFTLLIGIAFLIAGPLGYYLMHQWLTGFYYHVSLGVGVFFLAIGLSIVVAWITVGYRAVRAAIANPIESLRTE